MGPRASAPHHRRPCPVSRCADRVRRARWPAGHRGSRGHDAALPRRARRREGTRGLQLSSGHGGPAGRLGWFESKRGPRLRSARRRGDVGVTPAERVHAVTALGFLERHARFLVMVLLHAGVCLGRQYCTFAGIRRGQVVHDFFTDLVARGFATAYPRAHGSTHLYHLHGKKLYAAIGEPNSRFRRPTPLARAVERLMVLDAVLASPELTWLATEQEKVSHFTRKTLLQP